jgi:hypothetical protein
MAQPSVSDVHAPGVLGILDDEEEETRKLDLETFREHRTDAELENAPKYWRQLLAGARYLGNCYTPDTDVLTKGGWKVISKVTRNDEILTLEPLTETIIFQKSTKTVSLPYEGYLVEWNGKGVSLKFTPEQKLWVRRYDSRQDYQFLSVMDGLPRYCQFSQYGKWRAPKIPIMPSGLSINDHALTEEVFARFMGWYLSEGSTSLPSKHDGHYRVDISQILTTYDDDIRSAINDLGFSPNRMKKGWRFSSKPWALYLKSFGLARDKYVPQEIKEGSVEGIRIFLRTYAKGDGSKTGPMSFKIYTSSKRMVDDLQELALKAGWAGIIGERGTKGSFARHTRYVIGIKTRPSRPYLRGKPALVWYKGKVHDVEIPNHLLFIRRRGKPVWSGNSAYPVLRDGKAWGKWSLKQALSYFGKIVDTLRRDCRFFLTPPLSTDKAYGTSFWEAYREADKRGFITVLPPKDETEEKKWQDQRAKILKADDTDTKISEIFAALPDDIVVLPKCVALTGSYLYGKGKPRDVDLVLRQSLPGGALLKLDRILQKILGTDESIQFILEEQGAVWDHLPLYDLVLRKRPEFEIERIDSETFQEQFYKEESEDNGPGTLVSRAWNWIKIIGRIDE